MVNTTVPIPLKEHIKNNYGDNTLEFCRRTKRAKTSVYNQLYRDAIWYNDIVYVQEGNRKTIKHSGVIKNASNIRIL